MHVDNKKSIAVAKRLHFRNQGIQNRMQHNTDDGQSEPMIVYAIEDHANLSILTVDWAFFDDA